MPEYKGTYPSSSHAAACLYYCYYTAAAAASELVSAWDEDKIRLSRAKHMSAKIPPAAVGDA
jgi:hypothetical protein